VHAGIDRRIEQLERDIVPSTTEPDQQPTEHSMEARIARLESDSVKVRGLTLSMTMTADSHGARLRLDLTLAARKPIADIDA
jgi:hypothetical protein